MSKHTKIEELTIESLKDHNRILQTHIEYLRSQIASYHTKLVRNDELLNFYINALAEKDTKEFSLNAFSLN